MTFDDATWLNTLLASNALLVAAATVALLRSQRLQRRRSQGPEAAAPQDGDIERRMQRLERLAGESSRSDGGAAPATASEAPYRAAVRLARLGAGAEDLAGRCGLSRGEAELLTRLHGRRP